MAGRAASDRWSAVNGALPPASSVLAVCAHPDDESFGLGGVLAHLAQHGAKLSVLCFTHGEASTLHGVDGDLHMVRAAELEAASDRLGVGRVELLGYPDGGLAAQPRDALIAHVVELASDVAAEWLLVFDDGGITGHPDHQAATDAALDAANALDVPVVAWAVAASVATELNREFGTTFVGRDASECQVVLTVDRVAQLEAIDCHASQSTDNPVMRRRLELQHDVECLRLLR